MRKITYLIAAILMLYGGIAMADFVDHPQYAKINTFTSSVVDTIKTYQDQFFVVNGRYFQGLWLLGDTQVDGTTDVSVINTSKPSDFPYTWYDFAPTVFKKQLKIPVNVRIDVYQSSAGWGWKFVAECWIDGYGPDTFGNNGTHWVYRHNEGPEDDGSIQDIWYIQPEI